MPTLSKTPKAPLRIARESVHMTRAALGSASGCTGATIYDLENRRNQNPSHETAMHIVAALQRAGMTDYTMNDLFPVADLPPRPPKKRKPRKS